VIYLPQTCKLEIHFQDEKGDKSQATTRLQRELAIATAAAFAAPLADALSACSAARCYGFTLTYEYVRQAPLTPTASSDNTRAGVFIFESTVAEDRFLLAVPSFRDSLFVGSGLWAGIQIDQTAAEVITLRDLILLGNGPVAPVSRQLNDLLTLNAAYKQLRP
jgi:hypothetical protein